MDAKLMYPTREPKQGPSEESAQKQFHTRQLSGTRFRVATAQRESLVKLSKREKNTQLETIGAVASSSLQERQRGFVV